MISLKPGLRIGGNVVLGGATSIQYTPDGYFGIDVNGAITQFSADGMNHDLPVIRDVNIPPILQNITPLYISELAFAVADIDSVIIPNTIVLLADYAFYMCQLRTIQFSERLLTIASACFKQCTNLQQIILPSSLQTLAAEAFAGASALTTVVIPDSITTILDNTFIVAPIVDITIGANVYMNRDDIGVHGSQFIEYYVAQSSAKGRYMYSDGSWSKVT